MDETGREVGFCAHAIAEREPMVIENALEDPRFSDNPFVAGDFHLRFYAGAQIHGPNGRVIGTLCLLDTEPREFSAREVGLLEKFAALIEAETRR